MKLTAIHCFLVHPSKGDTEPPVIKAASVKNVGQPYGMLKSIFDAAQTDCPIEIAFKHNAKGEQQNDCRDLLREYIASEKAADGKKLAERLQGVTDNRSKLGLLFLMLGKEGKYAKLVLSRFPADQGILAEETEDELSVEFLEKVFVKTLFHYKAAVFEDELAPKTSFWTGRAVDKQLGGPLGADYWIKDFLASDLRTGSAAGTMRLAEALQQAIRKSTNLSTKQELVAAATLASNLAGKPVSGDSISEQFGLGETATSALRAEFRSVGLAGETFQFDAEEFKRRAPLKSIEMDNGGMMTAATEDFDEIFKQEPVPNAENEIEITTRGKIIDESIRKARR